MKTITKLWVLIAVLVVLTPIGIFLPERFKAGAAWGEWGLEEIKTLAGYVPQGLKNLSTLWSSLLPEYAFKGWGGRPLPHLSFAYIISAITGILVVTATILIIGKILIGKKD